MDSKANSTIIHNSAIVRYQPAKAWVGHRTEINDASVSLDFYGTDIAAYGTGNPDAYQIYLDDKLITKYVQRHFENFEVAEYYHCKDENPTQGFCVVLMELHNLDPTTRHTVRITSILGRSEFINVFQWLVQYDIAVDQLAASPKQVDLWPSAKSIEYTGSWSTLASGDKVTRTSGDRSKFTFTGSGVEIFGTATTGSRLCIVLDGEAQEIVPTNSQSHEVVAYTLPSLYSRLGLDQDTSHILAITNVIDPLAANPLVDVTIKRIVIWKDEGIPEDVKTTHQSAHPKESVTAADASTSTTASTSTPSSSAAATASTVTSIAVKCITFVLFFVIIWLVLRSRRGRQNAGLTKKQPSDADMGETDSQRTSQNSSSPAVGNQGPNVLPGTILRTVPPSIPDRQGETRTLPTVSSVVAVSSHVPYISHQEKS